MKKKKVFFLLLLMFLFNIQLFPQKRSTEKMEWVNKDTLQSLTFESLDKAIEWAKHTGPFGYIGSELFLIQDTNILILMHDPCSGVSCMSFYVFREKDNIWEFQTIFKTRVLEQINIRVDNEQEKMIFETPSGQIGEIPFERLIK